MSLTGIQAGKSQTTVPKEQLQPFDLKGLKGTYSVAQDGRTATITLAMGAKAVTFNATLSENAARNLLERTNGKSTQDDLLKLTGRSGVELQELAADLLEQSKTQPEILNSKGEVEVSLDVKFVDGKPSIQISCGGKTQVEIKKNQLQKDLKRAIDNNNPEILLKDFKGSNALIISASVEALMQFAEDARHDIIDMILKMAESDREKSVKFQKELAKKMAEKSINDKELVKAIEAKLVNATPAEVKMLLSLLDRYSLESGKTATVVPDLEKQKNEELLKKIENKIKEIVGYNPKTNQDSTAKANTASMLAYLGVKPIA